MTSRNRKILIVAASVIVLVVVVITCIPLFLNADNFRARIETTLSNSLGRKVTLGKLSLSVWSGSLVADNASVADDPSFSTQPFLQAASVKISVELLPLILSRQLHISGFTLDSPKIQLLRTGTGTWNYSSIGNSQTKAPSKQQDTADVFGGLTVGYVDVNNGQLTVGSVPAAGTPTLPTRVYDKLDLDVKKFSFDKQFPYSASASLPHGGSVTILGNAGPVNQKDASLTPFSARLVLKNLDPLAAGFVDAAEGISGTVDSITADALWNGRLLHITQLAIDSPRLTLASTNQPPKPAPANGQAGNTMLNNFALDKLEVKNGTITMTSAGKAGPPAVYQQLNANLTNFSSTTSAPFTLSAVVPSGGSVNASGHAGPLSPQASSSTPFDAQMALKHIDLATSGLLAADAGIGGIANLDAKANSNGQVLNATGTAHVDGIRLAKNGSPSSMPVDASFAVSENISTLAGSVQNTTVAIGKAPIAISGTYQTTGPATTLNLKVNSNAVSIDELQAFLPALGVHLPPGSRLQGGTLTTSLAITGSSASPVISGPVALENTQLSGFDLGSKLSTITALTGGSHTGSATAIRSLKMNVRVDGGDVRTDNVALVMPALGSATGNGTVSAAGALNYQMLLKLTALGGGGTTTSANSSAGGIAGQLMGMIPGQGSGGGLGGIAGGALKNGIPVAIGGTTSNPTFTPDMRGLATAGGINAAQGLLHGKQSQTPAQTNPLGNALGGLLNHQKN
ncbi:AsmA protein [Acidisarcina polymorpha]|uniref:AsmA protein n=1 Tax=Acidisarcina polymorpha TaxID=2211140 RepID=A0A2Z5G363_9BACT|nr:AsmA family protein [Acidisarcina polymorpha]AXC13107.1 AsmA protein [Acidisarcina polymorpha]